MTNAGRLQQRVWGSRWGVLREPVERLAAELGVAVWLVGGHVRDLLLGRPPGDLDLTVEGDGVGFARALAGALSVEARVTERFLAAELRLPAAGRVDVTTARSERYEAPGALPEVAPADLETDLLRRDFTVNSFALPLAAGTQSALQWAPGAPDDLARRRLRILHPHSFRDDPTRILRGVRQELALGFRMNAETETAARGAAARDALRAVSGERLTSDLEPLLARRERTPPACERLADLGTLGSLLEGLAWTPTTSDRFLRAAEELSDWADGERQIEAGEWTELALLALLDGSTAVSADALVDRLALGGTRRAAVLAWERASAALRETVESAAARPSDVLAGARPFDRVALSLLAQGLSGEPRERLRREQLVSRRVRLAVGAAELIEHGCAPGPNLGRALARTLAARVDGVIGPDDELDYALERMRRESPESPGRKS